MQNIYSLLADWVEKLLKYDLVRFGSLIYSFLKCYSLFARPPMCWHGRGHGNKQIMDGWDDKNVQKGLGPWYDGIRGLLLIIFSSPQPLSSHGWHILIEQLWAWQWSLWARLMTWNSNSFGRPASSGSYLSWPGSHRLHPLRFSRPPPPPPRGAPPRPAPGPGGLAAQLHAQWPVADKWFLPTHRDPTTKENPVQTPILTGSFILIPIQNFSKETYRKWESYRQHITRQL